MPEFHLDHGTKEASARFRALDEFTQGFIEALFFMATDWSVVDDATVHNPDESPDWSLADLSEETWQKIEADCRAWQEAYRADLDEAIDQGRINGYDETRAGHDFFFTRNGHGVGYWDRGLGEIGDKLTKAAREASETDLYIGDDGRLYLG